MHFNDAAAAAAAALSLRLDFCRLTVLNSIHRRTVVPRLEAMTAPGLTDDG